MQSILKCGNGLLTRRRVLLTLKKNVSVLVMNLLVRPRKNSVVLVFLTTRFRVCRTLMRPNLSILMQILKLESGRLLKPRVIIMPVGRLKILSLSQQSFRGNRLKMKLVRRVVIPARSKKPLGGTFLLVLVRLPVLLVKPLKSGQKPLVMLIPRRGMKPVSRGRIMTLGKFPWHRRWRVARGRRVISVFTFI